MKDSISRQEKIFIYLCDIPSTKTLNKFLTALVVSKKNTSNAHDIFYGIFDKIIENIILLRAKLLLSISSFYFSELSRAHSLPLISRVVCLHGR